MSIGLHLHLLSITGYLNIPGNVDVLYPDRYIRKVKAPYLSFPFDETRHDVMLFH